MTGPKKKNFSKLNLVFCFVNILPGLRGAREFHTAWTAMKQPATQGRGSTPTFSGPPKMVNAPHVSRKQS
ncbi:hypothetical protein I79_002822 [Cricetulus griseus]|uniref:Uncharacterized protein n=1 Tax=Cricetulus griseus TaxID=10029 RepID=G3GYE7_CRIGR|nr:hypothetical protein I79_002822 [Cricetulus griseus]